MLIIAVGGNLELLLKRLPQFGVVSGIGRGGRHY
jgi:hypothetical protein